MLVGQAADICAFAAAIMTELAYESERDRTW